MARLTLEQTREKLKAPKNKQFIWQAQKQESRLVLHCEPILEYLSMPSAFADFRAWVSTFLEKDKFARFCQLLTLPLETVDSTELIFDELAKLYDAHDRNIKIEFAHPEYAEDFAEYRETLQDEEFFKTKGFEALKTSINSFIVVDLPRQQTTPRPEPYFYLLPIQNVLDVEVKSADGLLEYIIFEIRGFRYGIDEEHYRVFAYSDASKEWELASEVRHSVYSASGELIDGVGYTPVGHFYKAAIEGSKGINKRGPVTSALGKLDWLLFLKTAKKYLDLYGPFPIMVSYASKCKYRDENNNECNEGFINYDYVDRTQPGCPTIPMQKPCPACSNKDIIGPGSFWKVDPPQLKEDADLMENPVKIIEVTTEKLEWLVSETVRLDDEIFFNCVGQNGEATNDQAINEKQVRSQFESRQAVLNRIKGQIEQGHKFALDTCARLRYGAYFIRSLVSYGEDFFLQGADAIALQYSEAKKFGMPQYEIATIRENYSRTKFKNNPDAYIRSKLLAQLEPYPDHSLTELKGMGIDITDPERFYLKLDFYNFVLRFERENINILEFGSLIDPAQKINIIQTKLLEYVRQQRKEAAVAPANPGTTNSASGAASR